MNLGPEGPRHVGRPESSVLNGFGKPDREATSAAGAAVDVYLVRDIFGVTTCEGRFFVRAGMVGIH